MTEQTTSETKFVTTQRLALFESWRDGVHRVWQCELRKPELTAQLDPYVRPRYG